MPLLVLRVRLEGFYCGRARETGRESERDREIVRQRDERPRVKAGKKHISKETEKKERKKETRKNE